MHQDDPFERGREIVSCVLAVKRRLKAMFRAHRCSPEDAEDILQEAMMVMTLRWEELERPDRFLLAVVRRQILRLLRHRRAEREVRVAVHSLEELSNGECPQTADDWRRDLGALLRVLPPKAALVVALRYGEGLSIEEIAAATRYSPASVRKLALRNLERLKRHAEAIGLHR